MILQPPNEPIEWNCTYCGRVNDFSHKTCDGCGAGKPNALYYDESTAVFHATTAGVISLRDLLEHQEHQRHYARMIADNCAAQMNFNNWYFGG
jgi:hypothetical protein